MLEIIKNAAPVICYIIGSLIVGMLINEQIHHNRAVQKSKAARNVIGK